MAATASASPSATISPPPASSRRSCFRTTGILPVLLSSFASNLNQLPHNTRRNLRNRFRPNIQPNRRMNLLPSLLINQHPLDELLLHQRHLPPTPHHPNISRWRIQTRQQRLAIDD